MWWLDFELIFVFAGLVIFAILFKEFKHGKLILKIIAGLALTWVVAFLISQILDLVRFWIW